MQPGLRLALATLEVVSIADFFSMVMPDIVEAFEQALLAEGIDVEVDGAPSGPLISCFSRSDSR